MLNRLKSFVRRFETLLAATLLLANIALSLSPLGNYLEEKLFLFPAFKVRSWAGIAPTLDPTVRLVLADDRTLKSLGSAPTFEQWERIANLLFDEGYTHVLIQEPQNLDSQIGAPIMRQPDHGILAVATVDTLGAKSSRSYPAEELEDRFFVKGSERDHAASPGMPISHLIGPSERTLPMIDRLGLNNVDDENTVPIFGARADGRVIPHVALSLLDNLRWDGQWLANGIFRLPAPVDGRFHVDWVPIRSILDKSVPAISFFDKGEKPEVQPVLSPALKEKLFGGRIAILVPAAFSGSRYLFSPIEGTVPAYLALVSMVNGAMHDSYIWRPVRHGLFLLFASLFTFLAITFLPVKRAVVTGVMIALLGPVVGWFLFHEEGWYLPFGQLAIVATMLVLQRGGHHYFITHLERTRLQTSLELGSTVQNLLLPRLRAGRCGRWEYSIGFHPYGSMAGDWYQVLNWRDEISLIAIGDVVGKGPSAALITATIAGIWHQCTSHWEKAEDFSVETLLKTMNDTIYRTFGGEQYTTISIALLLPDRLVVTACSAPPWWRWLPGSQADRFISTGNNPIGLNKQASGNKTIMHTPTAAEVFVAYSDGVLEKNSAQKRFRTLLSEFGDGEARGDGAPYPLQQIEDFIRLADKQTSQPDDVTVLVIRYLGEQTAESAPVLPIPSRVG